VQQREEFPLRLYREIIPAVVTTPKPATGKDKDVKECNIIE